MATFVAERYLAAGSDEVTLIVEAARRMAREMKAIGVSVRLIHAVHVPSDETCFTLFEAPSVEALGEAHQRAGISFDRIVAAIHVAGPDLEGSLE